MTSCNRRSTNIVPRAAPQRSESRTSLYAMNCGGERSVLTKTQSQDTLTYKCVGTLNAWALIRYLYPTCQHVNTTTTEEWRVKVNFTYTQIKTAMLFSKRKDGKENLLRQSLLNRLKPKLYGKGTDNKSTPKQLQTTLDTTLSTHASEIRQRRRSLPAKIDLNFESFLGPIDNSLLEMAEMAQLRRRRNSLSFKQISSQCSCERPSSFEEFQSRLLSSEQKHCIKYSSKSYYPAKPSSSALKLRNSFTTSGMKHNDSDDETYIDENGIYTTDLCFTEI